jgi:flagellar protein FliS
MSNAAFRAANAYRSTEIESRSPLELVVLLYDGLVRHLTEAREAIARGDLHAKRASVSRALAILNHLQNTVDREQGGEIATQLLSIYGYTSKRIVDGNMKLDSAAIDEALRLLAPLREAWAEIASARSARVSA